MSQSSFHEVFPITSTLLLLIIAFFILEQMAHGNVMAAEQDGAAGGMMGVHFAVIRDLGGLWWHPSRKVGVGAGEIWRFVSCMFLHFNLMHLAFNSMALFDLGRATEQRLSSERFLTIFVTSGLVGGLASFGWHSFRGSPFIGLGASGAVFGLIGMLLVYSIRRRDWACRDAMTRSLVLMAIFSVLGWRSLDHAAHLGGFVTGGVFGIWVTGYTSSGERQRWKIPAWICGAVLAVGLGFAILNHGKQNWDWARFF